MTEDFRYVVYLSSGNRITIRGYVVFINDFHVVVYLSSSVVSCT